MMPLNHILRKYTGGYKFNKLQAKINHLMYMDDIKLLAKNKKELETLIQVVRIYSQDFGMEFGTEKCKMLIIKSGKRHMTEEINLPNQEKIRTHWEMETYKYLGILEADTIKPVEMKEKIKREYLRRTSKLFETKLYNRNIIKGIKAWDVLVRYSGPFLKWTREELKQMDQITRRLMTMHNTLHPREDIVRPHVSWKECGRGIASVEDSSDASLQRGRKVITATRNITGNAKNQQNKNN